MHSDFKPVHLQQANAKLERDLVSTPVYQKKNNMHKGENVKMSLWKKFLGLFKSSPFELPEELYKNK